MNWSDAERRYQAQVTDAERRQRKAEAAQAAAEAKRIRDAHTIQQRLTQFLAAMRQAGNPGMCHYSLWDSLTGRGYWTLHPVTNSTGKPPNAVNWICSDGTFSCASYNSSSDFGGYIDESHNAKAVVDLLTTILHRHNVSVPEGNYSTNGASFTKKTQRCSSGKDQRLDATDETTSTAH